MRSGYGISILYLKEWHLKRSLRHAALYIDIHPTVTFIQIHLTCLLLINGLLHEWPLVMLAINVLFRSSSASIFGHHKGSMNNGIFSNLWLCAAFRARFMCHHELWPTSVSHTFSSLNSSLGFAGGKHYQKITIPSFDLFFKISLFHVAFLIFFSIAIIYPYFLQVGLLLQYVALFSQGTS